MFTVGREEMWKCKCKQCKIINNKQTNEGKQPDFEMTMFWWVIVWWVIEGRGGKVRRRDYTSDHLGAMVHLGAWMVSSQNENRTGHIVVLVRTSCAPHSWESHLSTRNYWHAAQTHNLLPVCQTRMEHEKKTETLMKRKRRCELTWSLSQTANTSQHLFVHFLQFWNLQ